MNRGDRRTERETEVDPTEALRTIEVALRLAIREVLGEYWLNASGAPDSTKLRERCDEERRRRDGAVASKDLLNYTETYHLTELIEKNWDKFKPVFRDKARTVAFFGVIKDIRNNIAHSRELVPFERELISGIAGLIRNQISLYRSSVNSSSKYYPLIESVTDNFGRRGSDPDRDGVRSGPRLEVGDTLTFTGSAFNARGKPVTWELLKTRTHSFLVSDEPALDMADGDSVILQYRVQEDDVQESFHLAIQIKTNSRFHRHAEEKYDDRRDFIYPVNPPEEN